MRNRLLFKGLTSALGLTCLMVACDTPEAPRGNVPATLPGVAADGVLPESPVALSAVTRASSFREKGFTLVRDRARLVAKPIERQVLGADAPLDMRVVNGRVVHLGGPLQTSFGLHAGEPFAIHDESTGIGAHVTLRGATAAQAEHSGSFVVYRGGHALGDVIHRVTQKSSEDFVVLEQAPKDASLSYDLTLDGGAALRLVANTLELVDSHGSPRLRVSSPYLVDSQGTRHVAQLAISGCAVDTSAAGPWGRDVVKPGAPTCGLHVSWHGANVAYPALLDPAWQSAGSMATGRTSPAITLLNSGKVLVSGGFGAVAPLASAELFDPKYGTWATTGNLASARYSHSSNIVSGGNVVAAGGSNVATSFSSAELYNVSTGLWGGTGSLSGLRDTHAAVSLANGTVLVIGGYNGTTGGLATAELYSGGTWTASGTMSSVRQGMSATLLGNGTVLVAGGYTNTPTTLATTDSWSGGAFSAGPTLSVARYGHTGTLLGSGSVLLAGGRDAAAIVASDLCGASCAASGSLTTGRSFHTATLMRNGSVMVAGGVNAATVVGSAEVYSGGAFATDNALTTARESHVAVLMAQGQALVAGGDDGTNSLGSAEAWPQPTVSATPGTNQVNVTWAGTPGNLQDYVSVAPAGSPATTITKFVFTNGVVGGSNLFTGIGPGSYVARVVTNNSYWIAAETAPFTVAGTATSVTLDPSSVLTAPSNIKINYNGMSGAATDWISIAPQGSPDTSYTRYQYTNGLLSGQATFAGVVNGTYVARAYFNNTYVKQAESAPFTITGAVTTVTLDGASVLTTPSNIIIDYANMSGSTTDWIAITTPGALDTQYAAYQYTNPLVNGSATFAGLPAGTYVGRAYFNNTYTKQAETAPFTITGTGPTVSINGGSVLTAPGTVLVDFTNMSGSATDWISIAFSSASDVSYVYYAYVGPTINGQVTFNNVVKGSFVARAYFNNSFVKRAQTPTFIVQ